ncbi:hypothetical protein A2U01_0010208, partial [Trifolium medium]|nr:hypothetical protein [Trifolium medium]
MGNEDDQPWQKVKGRQRKGRDKNHPKLDIATAFRNNREKNVNYTTYFFSDFPESFGAKAMLNVFQNYGDIMEVVIPAKRDKGGRRFGFARFDRVENPRSFEYELDHIIIGRDKLSVNLSRFQRQSEGNRRFDVKNGTSGSRRLNDSKGVEFNTRTKSSTGQNHHQSRDEHDRTYAHAVRDGRQSKQGVDHKHITVSYEAEKDDMLRLKKAFIGEVLHSGMSYNIQNQFHRQGYFGVKVTPLGSNLVLLEGQEEGEVEALVEDAKGWLYQWFRDVRPWSAKEIDLERIVWLRVYGIPAHAWNDIFFANITKPWCHFINADDVTIKKLSMDVARLMIRTTCQRVVDEFFDV